MKNEDLESFRESVRNFAENIQNKHVNNFFYNQFKEDIQKDYIYSNLDYGKNAGEIGSDVLGIFKNETNKIKNPKILELGTKRSIQNRPTHHKEWFQDYSDYVCTDIEMGIDVDIVADAHKLSRIFTNESFDIIVSCSTFEHFKYPWIVAIELIKLLRINGLIFIQTHQTFPLHAYPSDYFRFSPSALNSLFPPEFGVKILASSCEFPCSIVSERDVDAAIFYSYLNTCCVIQKIDATHRIYDYNEVI